MHIEKFIYQNRRDFRAIFKCEHCGHTEEKWGYDDTYFHQTVIPQMKCKNCGQTANPDEYRAYTPKYAENVVI